MRWAVAALRAAVVGETGRGVTVMFRLELSDEVPESFGDGGDVDVLVIVDDGWLVLWRWRDSGPGFSLAALR